ncbi:hypothetical protein A11Q_1425 [Pseudobdellovibrio exovorus JSS]|uniref:Peptidase M48 domain-containing protein n=2 Tax=Pseudobdellovibrio exovorus TaxID=453816 RepID=M4VC80_9BACT|nr:hypothetical protein A11Q_1425 [Pseudobdellovibrio exovorus JSS]
MRVLSLCFLLFPLKLFAGLTCSQLFNSSTSIEKPVITEVQIESFSGLKASQVEMTRNTIMGINAIVGNNLKVPYSVKLEIERQGDNAEFNWSDTIVFPIQFLVNGKPKHPKYAQTILAHEYGHYIFSLNLRDSIKNYAEFEQQAKMATVYHEDVRKNSDAYESAVIQLAKAKKLQDLALIEELKRKVEDKEKAFGKSSEKMDELNDLVKKSVFTRISVLSYHELFADIIAVMKENSPSAMSDALRSASIKDKDEKTSIEGRNFLNRIRLEGWNQSEPHIFFAPTRKFIWDHILTNPRYNQDSGALIKQIFFVIQTEISSRIHERSFELNPEEANRQLIDRLAQHFP